MTCHLADYARQGRTLDIPVFDAHSHAGKWALFDSVEVTETLAEMDRIGIRIMAVSSLPGIAGDIQHGNDQVADLLARYPDRFLGYAHVHAADPASVVPELERCFARPGFKGIKVYQLGVPYDDPRFQPVWEFARAHRAPVLAHTWAGNFTGFDRVAQAYADVPFLAAHTGSDLVYQPYVDAARRLRNFYLDLTGSKDHANLLPYLVREVGADQIVWGTDQPLFSMAQQVCRVLLARIDDDDKRKILYGTAARLFGLERE